MNKLAERIKELEEEPTAAEALKAIAKFCFDCPLHNGIECALCYLHKWRDGSTT